MKKLTLISLALAAAIASSGTAEAQSVKVYPLGTSNTLVRPADGKRYLMLPIQESMPDSRIEILVDGNLVRTIYVRLADSNVDYTVPLDLSPYAQKGVVTLNVISEVDRTHSRNASDFICWQNLQTADSIDVANREKFRPAFHHTPVYGWMNDPNGMFYKDGTWHLYYQWNPYGSKWQNMTWGHSSSRDLVNWEHHPAAIEPNGLGTIFSGSAVVDTLNTAGFGKDVVIALYTSCSHSQVQSLASSTDDGLTFAVYPGNPVIANPTEARDPNMFWHEPTGQWVLVLAHALEKEMQVYTSPDLKEWTLQSSFGKGYGSQEGVWECPDLFPLPVKGTDEQKWVLLCNINPGAPMGGSGTQYFIGDFDGKKFVADESPEVQKWMDYGKDNYATVTWSNAPQGRRTAIGWMSNWQYANEVPTRQFRSANTLPRELGLFRAADGKVYLSSVPSPEVESLRRGVKTYGSASISKKGRQYPIPALAEIILDYDLAKCDALTLTLSNPEGEKVDLTIDPRQQSASMDRRESGITDFSAHFPVVTQAPTRNADAKGSVRIFIDNCSVEAFDAEGRWSMTNLVFPENPYTTLTVKADGGKGKLSKLQIFNLQSK